MPAGAYVFPFRFVIPPHLPIPPSFERRNGWIRYWIISKIHRPGLKFCEDKKISIVIVPRLDVNRPEFNKPIVIADSKTLGVLWWSEGPVNARIEVPRSALTPGDRCEVVVKISNKSETELSGFAVRLRSHVVYYAGLFKTCSLNEHENVLVASSSDPIPPQSNVSKRVTFIVPSKLGPTFDLEAGKAIKRSYTINLDVSIPGLHFDMCMSSPIVIGTIPYNPPRQQYAPPPPSVPMVAPSAPPLPPPSASAPAAAIPGAYPPPPPMAAYPPPVTVGYAPSAPPPPPPSGYAPSAPLSPPFSSGGPGPGNEPSAPGADDPPVPDYLAMLYAQMGYPVEPVNDNPKSGNTNGNNGNNGNFDNGPSVWNVGNDKKAKTREDKPKLFAPIDLNAASSSFGFSVVGNEDSNADVDDDWVIVK